MLRRKGLHIQCGQRCTALKRRQRLHISGRQKGKHLKAEVYDMFRKAVDLEASWGAYITQGQILGFTDSIIRQYIEYLADQRLEAVGYEPLYNVSHPIPWVDAYASFNDHRTNFFEGNVINYSKGSISFDDF